MSGFHAQRRIQCIIFAWPLSFVKKIGLSSTPEPCIASKLIKKKKTTIDHRTIFIKRSKFVNILLHICEEHVFIVLCTVYED